MNDMGDAYEFAGTTLSTPTDGLACIRLETDGLDAKLKKESGVCPPCNCAVGAVGVVVAYVGRTMGIGMDI